MAITKTIFDVVKDDVKPYIDLNAGNIAAVETTSTAAAAHLAGTQIVFKGKLYDVIQDIAQGGTIIVGTNIIAANPLSSQIGTLSNALSDEVETRATLGAHNLVTVGSSISEWFLASDNGIVPTANPADIRYTVTLDNDTNSFTLTNYDNSGYYWACKYLKLEKNTNYKISIEGTLTGYLYVIGKRTSDNSGTRIAVVSSNVVTFDSGNYDELWIAAYPLSSGTYQLSFAKLMIRLATDANSNYTSYVPTNSQLLSYKDNGVLGAKNLLKYPYSDTTKTVNGVTFTDNGDGTLTINANKTDSADGRFIFYETSSLFLEKGKRYIVSLGTDELLSANLVFQIRFWQDSTDLGTIAVYKGETQFTVPATANKIRVFYYFANTVSISNKTVKPMIRLATDTDPTYQPYAMTNKELTDNKAEKSDLTSVSVTGTTNTSGSTITKGKYFYLNGTLCKALSDIASNATFTKNTNYEEVTAGALNALAIISSTYQNVRLMHNIPRLVPKDITSYVSDGSIWKRLNGTDGYELFEDIYVGDYWQMTEAISAYEQTQSYQTTGSKYVTIAGIDMHYGDGDSSPITYHHLDMVAGQGFDGTQHFGKSRMNSSNTTVGGYVGSEMFTTTIGAVTSTGKRASADATATINEQLYAEFGTHLKTHRCLLSNAIDSARYNRFGQANGASSGWAWTSVQAVFMTEIECYGSIVWSSSGYDTGNGNKQLPLFAHSKKAMNNRSAYYWLRDVASSANFCYCGNYGNAGCNGASDANACVRPRFILA